MFKYIAMYRRPADPEGFERQYFDTHLPLVVRTPGVVRTEVARVGRVVAAGFLGEVEPYLITEMYFESAETAKAAFATPEWAAAGANLTEIGGMDLVTMFTAEAVDSPA